MSELELSNRALDPWLQRFRERVTAYIAIAVVAGTILLIAVALRYIQSDQIYARVKDLLLLVMPLVGYVIGYYFNKATTEARAEKAEATVQSATSSAQQAIHAQVQAHTQAQEAIQGQVQAHAETHEAKLTLSELVSAIQQYTTQTQSAPRPGTLRDSGDEPPPDEARESLQAALGKARRVLEQ